MYILLPQTEEEMGNLIMLYIYYGKPYVEPCEIFLSHYSR